MNKFLLFAGTCYYARGGFNDFIGAYATAEEAIAKYENIHGTYDEKEEIQGKYEWCHVVDIEKGNGFIKLTKSHMEADTMKTRQEMLTWLVKNVTEWPKQVPPHEIIKDSCWLWITTLPDGNPMVAANTKGAHCITRDDWQQARNTYSPNDLRLQEELRAVKPSVAPVAGVKHDSNKWRFSLLPWKALSQVVAVLEFGATKYAPDNWMQVDNARERYFNAAQRHIMAWWLGEKNDPESGLHHLAHACCCILFLLHMEADK